MVMYKMSLVRQQLTNIAAIRCFEFIFDKLYVTLYQLCMPAVPLFININ